MSNAQLLEWLPSARAGSGYALGRILESCRNWLLKIANEELDEGLKAKLGASDIVQESLAEASAGFGRFTGQSEEELFGWLRQILKNNIRDCQRKYHDSEKRAL